MSIAPEQFREGCEDPHKRMLQRLEHEKYLRKEAARGVEEEKTRRDAMVAKLAQQRANIVQLEVSCQHMEGDSPSQSLHLYLIICLRRQLFPRALSRKPRQVCRSH